MWITFEHRTIKHDIHPNEAVQEIGLKLTLDYILDYW